MTSHQAAASPAKLRLWTEFVALFIGVPVAMAATFGLYPLFPVIIGLAVLSCLLLFATPGWRFRKLLPGPVFSEWRIILAFTAATTAICLIFVFWLAPEQFLFIPRHRPELWLVILIAYPLVSAFPQEIIFRSLFFERYGGLFPGKWSAVLVNGAVFGFGHLFYDNWVTITMTGCGGAIMGWAYLRHGTIGLPWILHAIAGQIIFTVGLGVFFYHGAVGATP